MPNHITNILSMKGPEHLVERVRKAIASYNENSGEIFIDFQKINPLPKDLEGTTAPPRIVSEEEYHAMRKRIDAGDLTEAEKKLGVSMPITEDMRDDLIAKYGAADWYDWQCENWGTKWNAYSQELLEDGRIIFQTAWSSPSAIFETLSSQHPEVYFTVKFADEDFGSNTGQYTFYNGEAIEIYLPEAISIPALKMASEVYNDAHGDNGLTYRLEDVEEEDMESDYIQNLIQCVYEMRLVGEYSEPVWKALEEKCVKDENYEFANTLLSFKEGWHE